jgi:hypothetical protein
MKLRERILHILEENTGSRYVMTTFGINQELNRWLSWWQFWKWVPVTAIHEEVRHMEADGLVKTRIETAADGRKYKTVELTK